MESQQAKPQKGRHGKAKPQAEPSLAQLLGGNGSKIWERFWKTANCWNRDKVPAPKALAKAWLDACTKAEPKAIYLGALHYRDQFLPPIRAADETKFMKSPLVWLTEEGWNTEMQALAATQLTGGTDA